MSDQKPTICRIVLFHAGKDQESNGSAFYPAIITHVWSETCVNLTAFPDNGLPTPHTSVPLLEEPGQTYRWSWPPRED